MLSLIILVMITGCKPDEPTYLGEFRLGEEGEAYIKFEPGSYWVYEESTTGVRDTFIMDFYNTSMVEVITEDRTYSREDIQFRWSANSGTYTSKLLQPFAGLPERELISSLGSYVFATKKFTTGNVVLYAFPFSNRRYESISDKNSIMRVVGDTIIDRTGYEGVVEMKIDKDPFLHESYSKYYWAKNVGIVKKEYRSLQSNESLSEWELIEKHLTQ